MSIFKQFAAVSELSLQAVYEKYFDKNIFSFFIL